MSKGNVTENDLMKFYFNAIAMPAYGGNLYLSLHTADPGEGGDQLTSEADYTDYARVLVSRDVAGWLVVDNLSGNVALKQFPQCGGGTNVITHVAIGTAASGAGQVLYSGALDEPLTVTNLVQPQFAIGALIVQED